MRQLAAGLLVAGALVAGLGPAGAGGGPTLRVTDLSPLTVQGVRFHARARLHVTLVAKVRHTRSVTANRSGSFRTVFAGVDVGTCENYVVRAIGSSGIVVAIKRGRPECGTEIAP